VLDDFDYAVAIQIVERVISNQRISLNVINARFVIFVSVTGEDSYQTLKRRVVVREKGVET